MPADRLHKLFGKFSQLDVSTTRQHGGTGLGLAICRELCELMNGSISAESVLGQGSTFTVILRLEWIGDGAERTPSAPVAPRPPAATKLRILAAEDNAVNRLVLKTFLAQLDIEPTIVEDGARALQAWRDGEWDVILMDVQMPVMDGVAATRAIRTLEHQTGRRRTPIVALTANAMSHQLAEYQAAEMDACVSKPLRVAELFATLERVLSAAEEPPRAAVA
jgi:CheY-like chemotaxis protein